MSAGHRPRERKDEDPPYWRAGLYNALRTQIGRSLRVHYQLRRDLPPRLQALLVQVQEKRADE